MWCCYFLENILSLKSYYQLSYVSILLTGVLLTITNILIKSWNVALDWSNAVWPTWWLKQSIKPCKPNESVVAIINMSCVYLFSRVWVFCFLNVQKFNLSPTLALSYTKAAQRRAVSCPFKYWFYVLRVVETYIKSISSKRCCLVTSSCLIYVYFTIEEDLYIKIWHDHLHL